MYINVLHLNTKLVSNELEAENLQDLIKRLRGIVSIKRRDLMRNY